ncbi:MAG: hypothetical protein RR922_01145 [Clostridia bacterium]
MQVIGFLGYVNKTDFIISVAKMLTICGKKVLIMDGTSEQRLKYTLPSIEGKTEPHIANYDGLYGAVNYESLGHFEKYIIERNINLDEYDYMIVDIDNQQSYQEFRKRGFDKLFFFFDHSPISVEKNAEILKTMFNFKLPEQEIKMTKVIYKLYLQRASEQYFENKFSEYEVVWEHEPIEFPYDEVDKVASIENVYSGVIEYKKFSNAFKNAAVEVSGLILGDGQTSFIRKSLKQYERRRK